MKALKMFKSSKSKSKSKSKVTARAARLTESQTIDELNSDSNNCTEEDDLADLITATRETQPHAPVASTSSSTATEVGICDEDEVSMTDLLTNLDLEVFVFPLLDEQY